MNWTELAQDRVHRQAFVMVVMKMMMMTMTTMIYAYNKNLTSCSGDYNLWKKCPPAIMDVGN